MRIVLHPLGNSSELKHKGRVFSVRNGLWAKRAPGSPSFQKTSTAPTAPSLYSRRGTRGDLRFLEGRPHGRQFDAGWRCNGCQSAARSAILRFPLRSRNSLKQPIRDAVQRRLEREAQGSKVWHGLGRELGHPALARPLGDIARAFYDEAAGRRAPQRGGALDQSFLLRRDPSFDALPAQGRSPGGPPW